MSRFSSFLLMSALTVGGLGGTYQAGAQPTIANNGFEQWAPQTVQTLVGPRTIQVPQDWQIGFLSSFKLAFTGVSGLDRSTIAHSGAASAQLTIGADSSGGDVLTRMAVTSSPLACVAWARNSSAFPDSTEAFFVVILTRTRPGRDPDTVAVGGGNLATRAVNTWERKVWPIVPLTAVTPDSALIWFLRGQGRPGEQTWIDDVSFTNVFPTAAPADVAVTAALSLSPNPVPAGTAPTLLVPARTPGPAVLTITDATGRTAGRVRTHTLAAGANTLPVPTTGLPAGTYLVTVLSAEGTRTARVVVE